MIDFGGSEEPCNLAANSLELQLLESEASEQLVFVAFAHESPQSLSVHLTNQRFRCSLGESGSGLGV